MVPKKIESPKIPVSWKLILCMIYHKMIFNLLDTPNNLTGQNPANNTSELKINIYV